MQLLEGIVQILNSTSWWAAASRAVLCQAPAKVRSHCSQAGQGGGGAPQEVNKNYRNRFWSDPVDSADIVCQFLHCLVVTSTHHTPHQHGEQGDHGHQLHDPHQVHPRRAEEVRSRGHRWDQALLLLLCNALHGCVCSEYKVCHYVRVTTQWVDRSTLMHLGKPS